MNVQTSITFEDERWRGRVDVEALAERVISRALIDSDAAIEDGAEVSLLFSNDERLAQLNSAWLGKEGPTNVLSFPASECAADQPETPLGDIIFSFDTIAREAAGEGKTLDAHLAHMIAHGFLHLLGFDHLNDDEADAMEGLESRILTAIGLPDPWEEAPGGEKV